MPRLPINYDNTCFYKIVSKDLSIQEVYIGHTTDFTKRKCEHKLRCNNVNRHGHNLRVYEFIRNNGGWDNFDMVLIDRISCSDRLEAEKIERQYIETLKGTLNMRIPTRTQAEHYQDNKENILMKNKEYRDRNKDAITDYTRKFYAEHKDEINMHRRAKYIENKDTILSNSKISYEKHKDKRNEYKRTVVLCVCGCSTTKGDKARHEKTEKHQNYLKSLEEDE